MQDLGKLIKTYGIAPAAFQRAAFITILSFVFFLATMVGFYVRQQIGYFLLATAFLVIYLFTLFSFLRQRRNMIRVFENGFTFRNHSVKWNEIVEAAPDGEIVKSDGERITLPQAIEGFDVLIREINRITRC